MRAHPAVAVLTLLPPLLAGCAGGSGEQQATPALTKQQAAAVLQRYAQVKNQMQAAAARGVDGSLLATAETEPQLTMDLAAYRLYRTAGEKLRPLEYGQPTFYIPRLTGYPRWFAADTTSWVVVRKSSGGSAERTRPVRHAMLFVQRAPKAPWLLAADPLPSGGAPTSPLSAVALDKEGYATAVRPDASGLAVSPDRLGEAHAAVLTRGAQAAPHHRKVLADGPATLRAHEGLSRATAQFRSLGITLTSTFAPHDAPVYALRTTDGGALVWYVLRQHESYVAGSPGKLRVGGDLTGLVSEKQARTRLDSTVLIQHLAQVPAGTGQAQITGMYRKAVHARGA
ncbi:hypothetical protein [Thermomonospora cellulosilytica]|uniref:DUF8094 domain-containing protein n=1 Tax=Thermomonospora cellulosilytica TaxID=1411118 RepID=A0A7W3N5I6_9ACTN|nr:hypothetical protein [Thermomonospora cellulosilytica]MBA9007852.1 hypothetical protein [Thermomonospora cellulosilytica]